MTTMRRLLARLLGLADPLADAKRRARLTEAEARAIAENTGGRLPDNISLHLANIVDEEGERVWVFATNTRGLTWHVKIRDRDGQVVGSGKGGRR